MHRTQPKYTNNNKHEGQRSVRMLQPEYLLEYKRPRQTRRESVEFTPACVKLRANKTSCGCKDPANSCVLRIKN